ncbi:MAG: hypothetical protein JWM44_3247 [Bacilli bacterium]|nr:hypothetical protein [Bacilli bacterium]
MIIYFLLIFTISLLIGITLRFMSFGMYFVDALISALRFPVEIWYIHLSLFNKFKEANKKLAFQILLFPLTNFPEVLVSYAEMRIDIESKIKAIIELYREAKTKEDRRKLVKVFEQNGIHVVKKERREMSATKENESSLKSTIFRSIARSLRMSEYEDALQHRNSL